MKPSAAAHSRAQTRPSDPQSEVLRELLVKADLTLSGAARLLEMPERALRGFCTGERVPRVVMLAMERLVERNRSKRLSIRKLRLSRATGIGKARSGNSTPLTMQGGARQIRIEGPYSLKEVVTVGSVMVAVLHVSVLETGWTRRGTDHCVPVGNRALRRPEKFRVADIIDRSPTGTF